MPKRMLVLADADGLWTRRYIENLLLPDGWTLAYDLDTPSCRLLNQPYDKEDENTQHYVIDGFILSPVDNVREDTPTAAANTRALLDEWRRCW